MKKPISQLIESAVFILYLNGYSITEMTSVLQISRTTISKIIKKTIR